MKTADELMNAGLLPHVSRELNPKNKKSFMIHRVRAVCDDILRPYVNTDEKFPEGFPERNRLMTDKEFEKEVYGLKNVLSDGSSYACSVCDKMTDAAFFYVPATEMWHPVGIKGKNVTAFDRSELGKSQFIVCGSECDDLLTKVPNCPSCGRTEIKWSEETRIDPRWLANIPNMKKFFEAFTKFDQVSDETKERRERDGLMPEEETELTAILQSPAVKAFQLYMAVPPPQVHDALCKYCGERVVPLRPTKNSIPRMSLLL